MESDELLKGVQLICLSLHVKQAGQEHAPPALQHVIAACGRACSWSLGL